MSVEDPLPDPLSNAELNAWEGLLSRVIPCVVGSVASEATRNNACALARLLPAPDRDATPWWSRVRSAIASVVSDELLLSGVALRGDSIRTMGFTHDATHIDLEIEPVRRSTAHRGIVRGQVEAGIDCNGIPVAFIEKSGAQAASTTLDDLGFFSATLPSGTYDIAFAMPGGPICVAEVLVQ